MSFFLDNLQLNKFTSILPKLEPYESYYVALASRAKYLSDSEKISHLKISSSMFGYSLVHNNDWEHAIAKAYSTLSYRKTNLGTPIPAHTVVCYASINPVNTVRGLANFSSKISEAMSNIATNGFQDSYLDIFRKAEKRSIGSIISCTSRKNYLDLDMDILQKNLDRYLEFFNYLKSNNITYYLIESLNGFHCMIEKTKTNTQEFYSALTQLRERSIQLEDDISVSKSNLVPVPGTLQNNHLVSFVEP